MLTDVLVIIIAYFAVFAWGSNEMWAMGLIVFSILSVLAIRLISDAWRGSIKINQAWFYFPMLILLVYVGYGLCARSEVRHSTMIYFCLAISYISVIYLTANGFRTRNRVKALLMSVLFLGAFEAVYGLIQYLGDYDYIWQFNRQHYRELATGTLINHNHYALLVNLCICTGIGYLYYRSSRLLEGYKLSWKLVLTAPNAAKLLWVAFWLAVMGLGVVFSMSRMGIVAMIACLGVMAMASKTAESGKRTIAIGLLMIFAVLGMATYIGIDAVLVRYENISLEREANQDRVALWRDAWKMIKEHPVLGQGLGTFQWIYPAYESIRPDTPAKYAHNNYLQVLAELGIVGLAVFIWIFVAVWRVAVKNLRNEQDPLARGVGLGTIGAMTAIALQEITDFGLYIPGVALMAAVLIGLNLRAQTLAVKTA